LLEKEAKVCAKWTPQKDVSAADNGSENMREGGSSLPLLESVTLALAASSARKGRFKEAEDLLSPLIVESESQDDALDLLAKVYAQQGKIEEAQHLWQQALKNDPGNRLFQEALQDCKEILSRGPALILWQNARRVIIICDIVFAVSLLIVLTIYVSMMTS
jgi:tetratricopeptide (TPR) repeat protein